MGLAELHLESLGTAKENLKARGRVANGEELGQIVGELHEEVKSNNGLKEAPWAGTGCPVRGLAEIRLVSLCPAQGPLEAGGGDVNGEQLGQKGGGVLHEEAKLTNRLKDTE